MGRIRAHLVQLVYRRRNWADLVCRDAAHLEDTVQNLAVVHLKMAYSACRRVIMPSARAYLDRELANIQT